MNIVLLGCECENMLNKLDNFGKKENTVVNICGDFVTTTNYLKSFPVDMLIIHNNHLDFELEKIVNYIKSYRPKIKMIVMYDNPKEVVEIYNKGIFVNKVISNKIKTSDLENTINDLHNSEAIGNITIIRLLEQFEFNKSSIGYHYIIESLNYCVNAKIKQTPKINKMYEILADDKYNANQINWNIRKALNSMNRLTEKEVMKKYFAYNFYPTPKEFLNRILEIYYKVH